MPHLDMELTERCNNDCIHCYINLPADDPARARELETGEIQRILGEAADLGCLSVRFTGGEPLLREDFDEIYVFARRLGLRVVIFTNATLLTPGRVDLFSRMPPLEPLEITLYGMTRPSWEAVTRAPGSFEATRRGIRLLQEKGVRFVVRTVALTADEKEWEKLEPWAASLSPMDGPPDRVTVLHPRARWDRGDRGDRGDKNRSIRKLRLTAKAWVDLVGRGDPGLGDLKRFCAGLTGPRGETLFACGAGNGVCVDAYGRLQACMLLRHPHTVYDLRGGTLKEGLTDFLPGVRAWRATNPAFLARCGRCFLVGLCEQCPARSWMEHGTLDTPVAYLCGLAHGLARRLGLLQRGERGWAVDDWRNRLDRFEKGLPMEWERQGETERIWKPK